MFKVRAGARGGPEAEGRDDLAAFGAIEELERNDTGGDCADQAEKFAQA